MKQLAEPERCLVHLDGPAVSMVRWKNRHWRVQETLDVWRYRSLWWTTPDLSGERREYHVLACDRGEITVFRRDHASPELAGWWVSGWWD